MGRRFAIVAVVVVAVVAATVGLALAQSGGKHRSPGTVIHVVLPPTDHLQFFDFNGDGLGLGDRLASVGKLFDASGTRRVGTAFSDCWIGDKTLEDGSPYVCTYVLRLQGGDIMTEGLDPHGASDVFFAVTGGTGVYDGANGEAEYIDTVQTDIYIQLNA